MGRPPRRFPRAQRSFLYPAFRPPERRPMDAMDDQPLHLQRDMTPSTHIEACMTMSVRRRSATRTAHSSHPHSSHPHSSHMASRTQFGMAGGRGWGGMASTVAAGFFAQRASSRSGGMVTPQGSLRAVTNPEPCAPARARRPRPAPPGSDNAEPREPRRSAKADATMEAGSHEGGPRGPRDPVASSCDSCCRRLAGADCCQR